MQTDVREERASDASAGDTPPSSRAAAIPDLPVLGHRNYWYPLIEGRKLRRHPVSVRALGEDIVLFRSGGVLGALADRCPHRGARLSHGRTLFRGTLSCGYHGWTFDTQGQCQAAIVEGPDSRIPGKVQVKAYPVQERWGLIWVFIGEGEPPALEEDLPKELFQPGVQLQGYLDEWNGTWRNATENYPDLLHALFVHRTSLMFLFNQMPAWAKLEMHPLPDGKGLRVEGVGGQMQAHYPGLGLFPSRRWWRVFSARRMIEAKGADVRMPGYILVPRSDPFFGFRVYAFQWPHPVDENRTRILASLITHGQTPLHRLLLRLWYTLYYQFIQTPFVGQDKRIIQSQTYREPEKLSASDSVLIQWRRLAPTIARKPRFPNGTASHGEGSGHGNGVGGPIHDE